MKYPISQQIADQARWINDHGGTLTGYVVRYGSKDDPNHYGDGGEAIYKADSEALADLIASGIRRGMFKRFV